MRPDGGEENVAARDPLRRAAGLERLGRVREVQIRRHLRQRRAARRLWVGGGGSRAQREVPEGGRGREETTGGGAPSSSRRRPSRASPPCSPSASAPCRSARGTLERGAEKSGGSGGWSSALNLEFTATGRRAPGGHPIAPVETGGSPCSTAAWDAGFRHFLRAKSHPCWNPHRRPPCADTRRRTVHISRGRNGTAEEAAAATSACHASRRSREPHRRGVGHGVVWVVPPRVLEERQRHLRHERLLVPAAPRRRRPHACARHFVPSEAAENSTGRLARWPAHHVGPRHLGVSGE